MLRIKKTAGWKSVSWLLDWSMMADGVKCHGRWNKLSLSGEDNSAVMGGRKYHGVEIKTYQLIIFLEDVGGISMMRPYPGSARTNICRHRLIAWKEPLESQFAFQRGNSGRLTTQHEKPNWPSDPLWFTGWVTESQFTWKSRGGDESELTSVQCKFRSLETFQINPSVKLQNHWHGNQ